MEFPEGGRGIVCGPFLENPEGWGGHMKNPFRGGGMDIFWNHTFGSGQDFLVRVESGHRFIFWIQLILRLLLLDDHLEPVSLQILAVFSVSRHFWSSLVQSDLKCCWAYCGFC